MIRKSLFPVFILISMFAFSAENPSETKTINMPGDVKAIIEKSCFGCHNTDSKNDKAKDKLNLSTFDSLTKMKMIAGYKEIAEVLEENEMPPAKFLEKNPDKKLTKAEKTILMNWANNEAKGLMK